MKRGLNVWEVSEPYKLTKPLRRNIKMPFPVRNIWGLQYIGAGLQYIGAPKFYIQYSGKEFSNMNLSKLKVLSPFGRP